MGGTQNANRIKYRSRATACSAGLLPAQAEATSRFQLCDRKGMSCRVANDYFYAPCQKITAQLLLR